MRKIIAITQVTLDGVMQAPGGPEEDTENAFTHGGWAMPFVDDAVMQTLYETVAGEFDLLLGRKTYDVFAAYWPNQGDSRSPKATTRQRNTSSRTAPTSSTGRSHGQSAAILCTRSAA